MITNVLRYPLTSVMLCLIAVLVASVGAKNLYFRGDYRVFFEEDNPQRVAYERMQNTFSKNESASIVIYSPQGTLFTSERLQMLQALTEESWQTPLSIRVDSISNFQNTYSLDGDLIVEDLVNIDLDLNRTEIAKIQSISLREADLVNKLISADGKVAMINITVQLPDGDQTKEITEISQFVRQMIAPYKTEYPDLEFRLSGIVIMTDAMFLAAIDDAKTLFPIMFMVVTFLLVVLLRSILATLATFFVVITSILATMGMGGWFGMFINIATVNVPIIVATLAIADSVHFVTSVRHFMQLGQSQNEAINSAYRINFSPILITSLTTAIGFLTLNFAKVPILADLGNLVAIGVIFACGISLFVLPALLSLFRLNVKANEKPNQTWQYLSSFCFSHYRKIAVLALILSILSIQLASQNQLNDIAIEYFKKGNEFRQDADFQQENLSGLSTIDFGIYTANPSEINEPEFLHLIDDFTAWLMQQPEVDHVFSYSNTIKRLNQHINDSDPRFYAIPESRELAAQYQLLYEMSLPFGLDMNNQIDIEKSAVRVLVTLKNLGSKDFTGFEDRAKHWLKTRAPEYKVDAASLPLIFAHIGKANMQSMLQGAVVALVLISILLVIALRSLKLGLISLIPNLLPALFGFAIWSQIHGFISMSLSVVITMTLGIIVDDTVHFLAKYKKAQADGLDVEACIQYAFKHVGNALTITTIVLASGFVILAFSDFAINADMGLLTSIIIGLALIIDILILPAVLLLNKKEKVA